MVRDCVNDSVNDNVCVDTSTIPSVVPQQFLSDNGSSFTSEEFKKHLEQFVQNLCHSSVGAHHSNGIAERNISTVMAIFRAMLHHQAIHWPDIADVELWPLTVLHAIFILN